MFVAPPPVLLLGPAAVMLRPLALAPPDGAMVGRTRCAEGLRTADRQKTLMIASGQPLAGVQHRAARP